MKHSQKVNSVWELYTTSSGGITCYDIFTLAWNYRGGKIYSNNKKYIILSGRCELTIEKDWKDIKSEISEKDGIFELAGNTPHIFYFPVDTRLIEWFSEDTSYKDFDRYREMKK